MMILYRLAKQMEERDRLHRTIREARGDVSSLHSEKTELEQQLLATAIEWKQSEIPIESRQ